LSFSCLRPFGLLQAFLRLGWQKNGVRNFQQFTRSHLTNIRWLFFFFGRMVKESRRCSNHQIHSFDLQAICRSTKFY
jgi:hypothetical protein